MDHSSNTPVPDAHGVPTAARSPETHAAPAARPAWWSLIGDGDDPPQLERFLEHLPAGVVVHAGDGRVVGANRLAAALLGMTMEHLLARSALDEKWHFHLNDGTEMPVDEYPALKSLRTRTDLRDVVVGIADASDTIHTWVLCNTLVGKECEWVVVSFTDCTALKTAQTALQLSEERLNLILLGTNDAPWDWNLVAGDIYYSDRWWTMLGWAPGELDGDQDLWFRLLHPDDTVQVSNTFKSALAAGSTYEIEFRLRHKDGHYVPVLSRGFVLRDARGEPVRVSGTNTDLSERKRAEQHIHQLAYFDQLTGLPNRRHLLEFLHKACSRAERTGQQGAVLFLDLDNFKLLNDSLGHDVGDLLLRQLGDRLRHVLREPDHLARLGGDEFVIVIEDLGTSVQTAAEEAEAIASKILSAAARKFFLPGMDYSLTASIGITMFGRLSGGVDALLKQADLAMYGAKAAGNGMTRFFDVAMQRSVEARSAMERDLRDALAGNQFLLYCQPQFDGERKLVGGEILLRWRHPVRGIVEPGNFIGLAEACGLIQPIGTWVLQAACRAVASWSADPVLGKLRFAVNVSAKQLHSKEFVAQTLAVMTDAGVDPASICLELTESLLADDVLDVTEKMRVLNAHGISFSVDDFGTGYSSLSYLQRFPLRALKIDQSFVQDEGAGAIVEVIIALAEKLCLTVVAEGVENASQFAFLKKSGCAYFQGYYLGRPLNLRDFQAMYGSAP